jgi:hypothetical protein
MCRRESTIGFNTNIKIVRDCHGRRKVTGGRDTMLGRWTCNCGDLQRDKGFGRRVEGPVGKVNVKNVK